MSILTFQVDKEESEATNTLTIRTSLPFSADKIKGLKENKEVLHFLYLQETQYQTKIKGKKSTPSDIGFTLFHVSYPQTTQALKLLAGTGRFFFKTKQLVCDIFGKSEFFYVVETKENNQLHISGKLKVKDTEFAVTDCDFICAGPPHWYIKGISLKFIVTDIAWKDLKQIYSNPPAVSLAQIQENYNIEEDPGAPTIVYTGSSHHVMQQTAAPLPLLILKDRSGAFADLWMVYTSINGTKKERIAFHNPASSIPGSDGKRKLGEERQWEQDLLQTAFIKKIVGETHYYCPMDNVAKSLTFLLEVGWDIEDWQGRRIIRQTDSDIHIQAQAQSLLVKGKLRFGDHEADLTDVLGAFTRRDRFVQLGSGAVGLLPKEFGSEGLQTIIEEGEIVHDGIKVRQSRFGSLSDLLESNYKVSCDHEIGELREKLLSFQGLKKALPENTFKGILRPYQQDGVNWLSFLYEHGFHGLLADDMGLGKTVQVLAFLSRLHVQKPVLIVLPTSLIFNWKREIERFLPDSKLITHHGPQRTKSCRDLDQPHIILTSYTTMRLDLALFRAISYECVILDEAQTIKNSNTQIAQAVYQLQSRFRLSLTGTPIENHLGEVWSHFRFIVPDLFGEEQQFLADMEAASFDSRYLEKIRKKIRPFLLRRKKEEVAKDLPERIEQIVWVEMAPEQRKVYDDFLAGVKGNLFKKVEADGVGKHRMEVLEAILRLRQICCHPLLALAQSDEALEASSAKLEALLQDIETAIEEGRKVLVYSQFTSMLSLIAKQVKEKQWNYVYLDGSTSTANREKVVSQFQEDASIPLFLISLKAGGIGLNLTAADYVFLYDPWWNEAVENQAIDRAHRIGRKETVIAKRYATVESIEEKMIRLKEAKRSLISDLMSDDLYNVNLTADDLQFLLS